MATITPHSAESLAAMSDAELNALAATLVMGWKQNDSPTWPAWLDQDGALTGYTYASYEINYFTPATDRNQSGELLARMAEHKVSFLVTHAHPKDPLGIDIEVNIPIHHGYTIPGNSARTETIAAILAAQAMEESR